LWEQTEEFKQLRPRTKVNYRYWLRKLSAWDDMPIALLDDQKEGRKLIHAAQKSLATHPHQANEVIATLKTLIDWAIRAGHMERNPAKTVKKLKTTQRKAIWSAEAERLWLSHADQTMRLAFLLGAYTGQRQADILSLRWDQISGGYISIEQAKTAEAVQVAIHPILAEELERTQRHGDFVLMWQDSRPGHPTDWKPYKDNHFKHAFRRVTLAAGLDGLQFRDLRRTLTTRLSALGVTPQQLSDVSGHRIAHSTKILDTYVARNPGDAVLRLTTDKKP
jgi:integrase